MIPTLLLALSMLVGMDATKQCRIVIQADDNRIARTQWLQCAVVDKVFQDYNEPGVWIWSEEETLTLDGWSKATTREGPDYVPHPFGPYDEI